MYPDAVFVKATAVTPISSNGQISRQFVLNGQTVNVTDTIVYINEDFNWLAIVSCGSIPNSNNLYTAYAISFSGPEKFNSLSELRKALNALYLIDSSFTTFEAFDQNKNDCIFSNQTVNIDTTNFNGTILTIETLLLQ
jgi:hypothetical protein